MTWRSKWNAAPRYRDLLENLVFELIDELVQVGSAAAVAANDGSEAIDIFLPSYELNEVHALRLDRSKEIT